MMIEAKEFDTQVKTVTRELANAIAKIAEGKPQPLALVMGCAMLMEQVINGLDVVFDERESVQRVREMVVSIIMEGNSIYEANASQTVN